jgi:hypothetical protein
LDAAAFVRALEQWKHAPAGVPAHAATSALARQAESLGEPELALRTGVLLAVRPGARGGSAEAWQARWEALRPHIEGHLVAARSSLPAWLRSLDAGGDSHLAGLLARMAG